MKKLTPKALALLLERTGLESPVSGMERLEPVIEKYMESLKELHAIDLSDEEVAPTFQPEPINE
jgi:hypothetical protein